METTHHHPHHHPHHQQQQLQPHHNHHPHLNHHHHHHPQQQQQPVQQMTIQQQQQKPTACCCAGCGQRILDRFLLHSLDRYWHTDCLRCSFCRATLADIGSSCFSRGGMILCKNDYVRLFGSSGECRACGQVISSNEFVMRTLCHVYHVRCFVCSRCHCPLVAGDRYSLVNGSLMCEKDCQKLMKGTTSAAQRRRAKSVKT